MRDCIFLVADSNMAACLSGFFERVRCHLSLGTGPFQFEAPEDLIVEGGSDPGTYCRAHEVLRPYLRTHQHAVVVLDSEWAGSPGAAIIAREIGANMLSNGWSVDRFAIAVIDPELEAWIWQDSPHVEAALGFTGRGNLRIHLKDKGEWLEGQPKPPRPKEAVEGVLRATRTPRSSALYRKITEKVSVRSCADPAFISLVKVLRSWFPPERE